MKELNELVELAKLANVAGQGSPEMIEFRVMANPDNILAIAEAFRELEQRAEAAEAKLAELAKQEPGLFEWRFKDVEGYMPSPWTALGMDKLERCRATFGDMVEYRFWHAAPVADLADLVPDKWSLEQALKFVEDYTPPSEEESVLFAVNSFRAAILRNIEEAK